MSAADLTRKAKAEEKYFAQRKSGAKPSAPNAGKEELVNFVEDGLNRGAKSKPKPLLGAAKRAAEAAAKKAAKLAKAPRRQDLATRELAALQPGAAGSCPPAFGRVLDNAATVTALLLACGVGARGVGARGGGSSGGGEPGSSPSSLGSLGALAATCRRAAVAVREPDWRRMAEGLCLAHGLLAVDLQV
jgi:hypothetical protein